MDGAGSPSSRQVPKDSIDVLTQMRRNVLQENRAGNYSKLNSLLTTRRKLSEKEKEIVSKVPLELLAREWLDEHSDSFDTRRYLVDNLLPTLVMGLEKLLTEVTQKDLADTTGHHPDFNPVNFLAQYLMRNNPRYNSAVDTHPYSLTMKEVSKELKRIAYQYGTEGSKLADLKEKSKERQLDREREEAIRNAERNRQMDILRQIFAKWKVNGETSIDLDEIRLALLSWIETLPEGSVKTRLQEVVSGVLSKSKKWDEAEFVSALMECGHGLSPELFQQLKEHMGICGSERRRSILKKQRREKFCSLFDSCDPDKRNSLDRLRVLYLLATFYDSLSKREHKSTVHNPKEWPILDVIEVEELEETDKSVSTASAKDSSIEGGTKESEKESSKGGMKESNKESSEGGMKESNKERSEGGMKESEKESSEGGTKESKKESFDGGMKESEKESSEGGMKESEKESFDGGIKESEKESSEGGMKESEKESSEGGTKESKKESFDGGMKESEKESSEGGMKESEKENSEGGMKESEKESSEGGMKESNKESFEGGTKESEKESSEGGMKESDKESSEEGTKESEKESSEGGTKESEKESSEGGMKEREKERRSNEGVKDSKADSSESVKKNSEEGSIESGGKKSGMKLGISVSFEKRRQSLLSLFLKRRLTEPVTKSEMIARMRKLTGMGTEPNLPSGPGAVWDYKELNKAQFAQLIELFLGLDPDKSMIDAVVQHFKDNYTESAEERSAHLEESKKQALLLARKQKTNELFDMWDNDHSGYLKLSELKQALCSWSSTGDDKKQAEAISEILGSDLEQMDKSQFQSYFNKLTQDMTFEEFTKFIDFLNARTKLTRDEQYRGECRKEFLDRVRRAGMTGGLRFSRALKEAVNVVHKDVEKFGEAKDVAVNVNLLQFSSHDPQKSCTSVCSFPSTISRVSDESASDIGSSVMESGNVVHIPSIKSHDGVQYHLPKEKQEEYDGSLVVAPIKGPRQNAVGTINVDGLQHRGTIIDEDSESAFPDHQVSFFQGVGVCLGEINHWIKARQHLMKVANSALTWINNHCPMFISGDIYVVQPGPKEGDPFNLLHALTAGKNTPATYFRKLIKYREDLFHDYLFDCVDASEAVTTEVYGKYHVAHPIRDHTGCTVAVIDIILPSPKSMTSEELKEMTTVLKLLTTAFHKLNSTDDEEISLQDIELEGKESLRSMNADVLFDHLMLTELNNKMTQVTARVMAELKSYRHPPKLVFKVIKALFYILYPDLEFEAWMECIRYINFSLFTTMKLYEPYPITDHPRIKDVKKLIDLDMPSEDWYEHGSLPTRNIFDWICACMPLLEAKPESSLRLSTLSPFPTPSSTSPLASRPTSPKTPRPTSPVRSRPTSTTFEKSATD